MAQRKNKYYQGNLIWHCLVLARKWLNEEENKGRDKITDVDVNFSACCYMILEKFALDRCLKYEKKSVTSYSP